MKSRFKFILFATFFWGAATSVNASDPPKCTDLESCLPALNYVKDFYKNSDSCKIALNQSSNVQASSEFLNGSDPALQKTLESILNDAGLSDATQKKSLAVSLVEINPDDTFKVASANGLQMHYAASLPKVAILYAAFHEIENGKLKLTDELNISLTKMIRFSSNEDATRVLNLVGKDRVTEILESEPHKFYDRASGGGLWVGKEYSRNSAYKRDPLHGISHGASALQVARLYTLLETGNLLNAENTKLMKEVLSNPGIKHKFVKALAGKPNTELYRKSGTWKEYHSDSVLVVSGDKRYVLVGLAHHKDGGDWLTKLATKVNKELTGF